MGQVARKVVRSNTRLGGRDFEANVIENPTVDDLLIGESKLSAWERVNGSLGTGEDRLPQRAIREYLVFTGAAR
jgi:hypothetical protein